jgi:plasmid replication initiation protein
MSRKKDSSVAVQSNSLVSAQYRLSLSEQFLVLMMISKIDYKDEYFQGYGISIKELANTLQLNEKFAYREAHTITDKLLKRILRIPRANGSLLKCNWIASAEHFPGRIILTPAPALRPYLLELREQFTKTPLEQVSGLRSQHSVRIYMLLRQYLNLGKFDLTVEEFRNILSLESEYPRFSELKRWVINPSQKELKLKTDLSFKLITSKNGRSVSNLKFIIIKNDRNKNKESDAQVINFDKISDANHKDTVHEDGSFDDIDMKEAEELDRIIFNEFIEEVKENDKFIYEYYLKHGRDDHIQNVFVIFLDKWEKEQKARTASTSKTAMDAE